MEHNLVINHNALDTAVYSMSPIELKLMQYCITKVRRDTGFGEENRRFIITHDDFAKAIDRDNCYNSMKAAVTRLQQRIVIINEPITDADGITHAGGSINVLSAQYWAEDEGSIKIEFSDRFMPYLTKLVGNYNKLFFDDIAHMKSSYSIRLYKLLRSHYNRQAKQSIKPNLMIDVEMLKECFQIQGKYAKHNDFKRKVIDVAVNEINKHSPLSVSYTQIKKGRRIDAYSFKVEEKAMTIKASSKSQRKIEKSIKTIRKAFEAGRIVSINSKRLIDLTGAIASFESGAENLYSLLKSGAEVEIKQAEELF